MQFAIPLSKGRGPLFRQVYLGLRQAVSSGTFRVNDRLPSTRDLADQLGVSRSVVLLAYDHLLAEGLVNGRSGSGTYVAKRLSAPRAPSSKSQAHLRLSNFGSAAAKVAVSVDSPPRWPLHRYDFAFGRSESDIEMFPFEMWQRMLLRHARRVPVAGLDYGPAAGSLALRQAICGYLRRSRAVVSDPSRVIIVNGSQQALDLITRVLLNRGDGVAIENPTYQGTREILLAAGAKLLPAPVDHDGLDPDQLPRHARMCFVTPSHQFPTGAILSYLRRLALLAWAKRKNSVIVEDDYDGEFCYHGQPLPSVQSLDAEGRVIYVGTFSRTVFPSLRVGYLIVPKSLAPAFIAAKWLNDQHSPTLEQQTLAEFIVSGAYERHLRHLRRKNKASRAVLLESIHKHLDRRVDVTGDGAGAHVALWLKKRVSEAAAIRRAAARGVGVYGMSPYFLAKPSPAGIILGYSRLREHEIREGIRRLSEVL